jgi:Asp-tRNA(Asn)/Glu-tRNA(Gln) amidotransferase A subunit family amidase
VLNAVSSDGNWKGVAVPSRLYDKPSPERPLAGKRLSIKVNIKLSGIATSLESQSFLDTYGTDTETAPYISRLIRLGVVIVGKTKMSAFASGENPPENWVGFQCPRNPRGGRYQQPTGSSIGAGASLAAYEWLDFGRQ